MPYFMLVNFCEAKLDYTVPSYRIRSLDNGNSNRDPGQSSSEEKIANSY